MTNLKATKKALVSSVLALVMCFTMLLGTTFAWFTDSVTSAGNKIEAGTLDVELILHKADGTTVDISKTNAPIFGTGSLAQNNASKTLWEPGKTQTVYLSIKNNGTLDLKYKVAIEVTDVTKNLTDVMEYIITPDAKVESPIAKTDLDWTTGNSVIEGINLVEGATDVALEAGDEHFFALSVHMDEYANNDYQGGTITFDLKVLAGQLASEDDSFDNQYDINADYGAPLADVSKGDAKNINATIGMGGPVQSMNLVTSYVFKTTETVEQAEQSPYRWYHADFVVSSNKDIEPGAVALAGYYPAYCEGYNNGNWVALMDDTNKIPANTQLRLLDLMLDGGSMNYAELCQWVPEFHCGIAKLGDVEAGTTITVELRLYETTQDPNSTSGNKNIETGEYITIGVYNYTFN